MKPVLILALALFGSTHPTISQKTDKKQPPQVKLEPSSIDYGEQVARGPGKSQRVIVTNTGEKKLYINSVLVSGDEHEDFTIIQDTCTGANVGSGKSCLVDIRFRPSKTEARNAIITFTDSAADSPQKLPVTGKGINSAAVRPSEARQ